MKERRGRGKLSKYNKRRGRESEELGRKIPSPDLNKLHQIRTMMSAPSHRFDKEMRLADMAVTFV